MAKAGKNVMSDPLLRHYFLDISSIGVQADIGLNDVPIVTDGKGAGVRTILPVNEWIWSGQNHLTVQVAWPGNKPHAPGLAELKVSLFEADPKSDFPEPMKVHAEAVWPLPTEPELYPHRFAVPMNIEFAPPTRLWAEAEPIGKVTDEHKAEIIALVEQLRAALMDRNAKAALKLLTYRYQDEARAYGTTAEGLLANVAKQYEIMWAEPSPKSAPLDPEAASFIVGSSKKILKVAGPNFKEALVIQTQEAEYQIPIFAARVSGRWLIAR